MASIFPGSPSVNDIFTSNGTTWQWNGEAWIVVASDGQTFTNVITSPSSQIITADSPTDTLTIAAGTNISVSANSSNDTLTISSTIDTQGLINTASAAAYASASGYTNYVVDGLDTLDIEENTNLYFTNQRAIDATSSLITSASANALTQANTYSNSASAYSLSQANTYSNSASANALVEANLYSNSASANALAEANAYTDSASASLVAYTNQEISALDVFSYVATSPSTQIIQGDSNSDTLTFIAGENISISADSSTDSITINSTGNYTSVDSIAYPDYIVFDTTPELTSASGGTLAWDTGENNLSLQLNANLNVGIGQEIIVLCNNGEATQLNKGEVVRLSGAQGQRPKVTRAYNTNDTGSALTIGIVAENITAGGEGFIVTQGVVRNINTNGFNEGDILYLSASAGVLTTVKPQAPNHYVFVGVVVKKNASSGRIYVKPQNGYELDELHNVRIVSEQNGDIIIWNSASSLWLNEPLQNYLNSASVSAFNAASANTLSQINALTTTDIEEGTNLYFTNQRAINAGSATYIPQTSQQSIINSASAAAVTYLVDSAPSTLDTLNELAAALGDDPNYATTITNALATKLDSSTASATYLTQSNAASTYLTQAAGLTAATASATYLTQVSASTIYAPIASPSLTGTPTAPTASVDTNTTQLATTQYVVGQGYLKESSASATYLTQSNASATYLSQSSASSLYLTQASASTSYVPQNATGNEYIQDQAAALFNHALHVNASATYDDASNRVIITANAGGGGGATVAYQTTQPDTATLPAGSLWVDSDQDTISGLLPATFTRWVKVLSASATTISGLDDNALSLLYTPGYEKVFINGTLLVRGSDYTATTGTSVVLPIAAEATDVIEIHSYEAFQIANTYTQAQIDSRFNNYTRWSETYTASAATITGVDDYANALSYTSGYERVFVNGVLLHPSEYTRTSASVITPLEPILAGDVVEVFNIVAAQVGNTYTTTQIDSKYNNRTRWTKTYSASAIVISGADDNANSLSYTSGNEEVYLNGILLTPVTDYARTSASVITLGAAVVSGDIIDVVNIAPFNVASTYSQSQIDAKYNDYTRWTKTLSASATTISGTDNNSLTLSYTPGKEQVYINGSLIMRGTEYTASSGSSIVLNEAAVVDDVIDVVSINPFNIANVYTQAQVDSKVGINGGMVLINKTDFSGSSAVNLNNIFSSTYDNYRFVFTTTSNSATGYLFMRLRSAGSDITASNYFSSVVQAAYGSTALGNDNGGNSQSTWNRFGYYDGTTDAYTVTGDILLPFATAFTSFNNTRARSGYGSEFATGVYKATTSVDGITIYPAGGTITGTVRVYGYRNDV